MKDEELIELIINGNTELYAELIERYKNKVYSTAYSYTRDYEEAKDLTQEIFIKVYNNLSGFQNKAQFSTYLYRVAVNRCIDWTRRKRPKTISILTCQDDENVDIYDFIADYDSNPEEILLRQENMDFIRREVNNLPEIYSTVMIMYYFQEFSPQEISDILGVPRKTIDTRLFRARNLIKERIKRKLDFGGGKVAMQPS
ncbi:RNA polymerase sigma factor [Lutispora saccharofermentans]|uniref:Sigma-70 family RNA polymerase sigma factor n=1 Tax=Lutispora saccharofermentans TaxID=3024236 RepID=A0ABT1NJ98_9FIRM|nr:sigma-70 family RNA polymerase sigma factor [Lutispora saccharofermentans]MCQ1531357.1 sigma-70 family RNA polymerase sigma factor [Lutispora saccharofermentans]